MLDDDAVHAAVAELRLALEHMSEFEGNLAKPFKVAWTFHNWEASRQFVNAIIKLAAPDD